jgi:hypothetical protein
MHHFIIPHFGKEVNYADVHTPAENMQDAQANKSLPYPG